MTHDAQWVSVKHVAETYGVTERFVRELIASGALPASRVGSRLVRIRRTDADALATPLIQGRADRG